VAQLRLHPETASAWRLDPRVTILITGQFGAIYPSPTAADALEAANIEPFRVRAVRPDDRGRWWEADWRAAGGGGDMPGGGSDDGFGLQWTLNDRLKGFFRILAAQAR
jgi:hypothetical protein